MRIGRKGIIEMMETFMVLFIIFILIGLGMYFFGKGMITSAKDTQTELCLKHGTEMMLSIANLPDINCGSGMQACIDTAKLEAFRGAMADKNRRKILESGMCQKSIVVEQVYPEAKGKEKINCTMQELRSTDFPGNCGKWAVFEPKVKTVFKSSNKIVTPVSLYYPNKEEYGIGRLVITVYTT